jgi:hypothetical protein
VRATGMTCHRLGPPEQEDGQPGSSTRTSSRTDE